MAIEYFGETDTSGIANAYPDARFYANKHSQYPFTCPGSGNQTVKELSIYARDAYGATDKRALIGVYSGADLGSAAKICEGSSPVDITGASYGWKGHLAQADITPNPTTLTGGVNYCLAFGMSDEQNWMEVAAHTGTSGDYYYENTDYIGGLPATLAAMSANLATKYLIRCGVEEEVSGSGISIQTIG